MKEKIAIPGPNGTLNALLQLPAAGYAGPVTILMHGFMANLKMNPIKSIAAALEKEGVATLRFDFNGHGKSGGRYQDMTVGKELSDARAVLDYVKKRFPGQKTALLGHSQGGVVAGMTAGEFKEDVAALVQLSPAAVLKDDALNGVLMGKHYDPANPPETLRLLFHRVGRGLFLDAQKLPIYEVSSRYDGPVLLIHGKKDRIVPYSYSERYHALYPQSELVLLEKEGHLLSKCRKEVVARCVEFLKKNLR